MMDQMTKEVAQVIGQQALELIAGRLEAERLKAEADLLRAEIERLKKPD